MMYTMKMWKFLSVELRKVYCTRHELFCVVFLLLLASCGYLSEPQANLEDSGSETSASLNEYPVEGIYTYINGERGVEIGDTGQVRHEFELSFKPDRAKDLVSGFLCSYDFSNFRSCTSPYRISEATINLHVLRVRTVSRDPDIPVADATATWEFTQLRVPSDFSITAFPLQITPAETAQIRAIPLNHRLQPITGIPIELSIGQAAVWGYDLELKPFENGTSETVATFFPGDFVGKAFINANVNNIHKSLAIEVVTQKVESPPDLQPFAIRLTSDADWLYGDGISSTVVYAWVEDQYGYPITSGQVFFSTGTIGTIAASSPINNGWASAVYISGNGGGSAYVGAQAGMVTASKKIVLVLPDRIHLSIDSPTFVQSGYNDRIDYTVPAEFPFPVTIQASYLTLGASLDYSASMTADLSAIAAAPGTLDTSGMPYLGKGEIDYYSGGGTGPVFVKVFGAHASATARIEVAGSELFFSGNGVVIGTHRNKLFSNKCYLQRGIDVYVMDQNILGTIPDVVSFALESPDYGWISPVAHVSNGLAVGIYDSVLGYASNSAGQNSYFGPVTVNVLTNGITSVIEFVEDRDPGPPPWASNQECIKTEKAKSIVLEASPELLGSGSTEPANLSIAVLNKNGDLVKDVHVYLSVTSNTGSVTQWGFVVGDVASALFPVQTRYYAGTVTGRIFVKASVRSLTDGTEIASAITSITLE